MNTYVDTPAVGHLITPFLDPAYERAQLLTLAEQINDARRSSQFLSGDTVKSELTFSLIQVLEMLLGNRPAAVRVIAYVEVGLSVKGALECIARRDLETV